MKTIGLLILVLVLLGATGLIASRLLFSQSPTDSSVSLPKTKATFQKEVNISIPTPTSPVLAQAAISPTDTQIIPTSSPTPVQPTIATPTPLFSPTPTETILAFQGSVTSTVTASPTAQIATNQTLPSAGSFQYPLIILLAASLIVILSLIY